MAGPQLSDGRPDGQIIGQSATDPIGFHGTEATAQGVAIASSDITVTNLSTAVNAVIALLRTKGLCAT
jgi:hypothetical protein